MKNQKKSIPIGVDAWTKARLLSAFRKETLLAVMERAVNELYRKEIRGFNLPQ